MHGAKTVDELRGQLNIPMNELSTDIKEMLRLELIEKRDGFPTRYALKTNIAEEVSRRKKLAEKDKNAFRVRATIEGQAVEPEVLQKQLTRLADILKADKDFLVYECTQAPVLKQEDSYSSYLDLNVSLKNFKTLVRFMYTYGPTTVELLSPSKIEFTGDDFQDGLNDWSLWIHRYAETLTKFMNRTELEEFNRKLLK